MGEVGGVEGGSVGGGEGGKGVDESSLDFTWRGGWVGLELVLESDS